MKEATGELNITVAIVIGIGALSAFFYFTIWPLIRQNMDENTKCSQAVCEKCSSGNCITVKCCMPTEQNGEQKSCSSTQNTFECPWKG